MIRMEGESERVRELRVIVTWCWLYIYIYVEGLHSLIQNSFSKKERKKALEKYSDNEKLPSTCQRQLEENYSCILNTFE